MTSCSAGTLASWLTSPLDMAKLRLQIQRGKMSNTTTTTTTRTFQGVVDCLSHSYKQGGVHGLFRGAGARVLHFAPTATTITMSSYEIFRSYFDTRIQ
jgi:inorganic pyrophosphatase